jgi:hypothetical protein
MKSMDDGQDREENMRTLLGMCSALVCTARPTATLLSFFSLVKFMWFLLFHFFLFCENYIISLITTQGKGTEPSPAGVGWLLAGRMVDADRKQLHQARREHDAHRR